MDKKNLDILEQMRSQIQTDAKIHLLLAFAQLGPDDIRDPYRGDEKDFYAVLTSIMHATSRICDQLS